jgi:pterin-4a-carbinolamine dehydratase
MDPSELLQLQQQLKDWSFSGQHHMHKSWRFRHAQQALTWHGLAKELSARHGGDCYFYLGHVGSGRIETDILNHLQGHLTREDLEVALLMDRLEDDMKEGDTETPP